MVQTTALLSWHNTVKRWKNAKKSLFFAFLQHGLASFGCIICVFTLLHYPLKSYFQNFEVLVFMIFCWQRCSIKGTCLTKKSTWNQVLFGQGRTAQKARCRNDNNGTMHDKENICSPAFSIRNKNKDVLKTKVSYLKKVGNLRYGLQQCLELCV